VETAAKSNSFLQTSLQLGSKLLKGLGVMSDDVVFLSQLIRDSMELQAQEAVGLSDRDLDIMKPLQVLQNQRNINCSYIRFNKCSVISFMVTVL